MALQRVPSRRMTAGTVLPNLLGHLLQLTCCQLYSPFVTVLPVVAIEHMPTTHIPAVSLASSFPFSLSFFLAFSLARAVVESTAVGTCQGIGCFR